MGYRWPSHGKLKDAVHSLAQPALVIAPPNVIEFSGTAFRFSRRKFFNAQDFTSGYGATIHGGRFTPRDGPRTVYLALEAETALAELMAYERLTGLPISQDFVPRVLASAAVGASYLVDLRSAETLKLLGLKPHHITEDWWQASDDGKVSRTQALGQVIFEAGFTGVIYPSARHDVGTNLALFPENFTSDDHALMIDPETS